MAGILALNATPASAWTHDTGEVDPELGGSWYACGTAYATAAGTDSGKYARWYPAWDFRGRFRMDIRVPCATNDRGKDVKHHVRRVDGTEYQAVTFTQCGRSGWYNLFPDTNWNGDADRYSRVYFYAFNDTVYPNCYSGYNAVTAGEGRTYGEKWDYINDWVCLGGYSGVIGDNATGWTESDIYLYPAVDTTHGNVFNYGGKVPGRVQTGDCNWENKLDWKGNAASYGNCDNCYSFGFAWMYSPSGASPKFLIGADDDQRTYVNGTLISSGTSCCNRDNFETGGISMPSGWSRILFKVRNGGGGFNGTVSLRNGGDRGWNEGSVTRYSSSYGLGYEQDDWYPRIDVSNFYGGSNPQPNGNYYGNSTTVAASGTASVTGPVPLWKVMFFDWGYGISERNYTDVSSSGVSWSHTQTGVTGHRRFHFFSVSKSKRCSFQNSGVTGGWNFADGGAANYMDVYVDNVAPQNPSFSSVAAASTTQINLAWAMPLDQGVGIAAGSTEAADEASATSANYYRRGDVGMKIYRGGSTTVYDWGTETSANDTGLTANTAYTYTIEARDNTGSGRGSWHNYTGQKDSRVVWTLSVPPTTSTVTRDASFICAPGTAVNWTAVGGFGPGKVQYYRYVWNQSPTHSWADNETQWTTGALATTPTSGGTWYLHLKGYNGANAGNGTLDYPVVVANGTEKWIGGNGPWDTTTPGFWEDATPNAANYCDGHDVLFDDSPCSSLNPLALQAAISPASLVNNSTSNDPVPGEDRSSSSTRPIRESSIMRTTPGGHTVNTVAIADRRAPGGAATTATDPTTAVAMSVTSTLSTDTGGSALAGNQTPFGTGTTDLVAPRAAGAAATPETLTANTKVTLVDSAKTGNIEPGSDLAGLQQGGLSAPAQPEVYDPIAALEALATPAPANASGQALELGVLTGTKVLALQTEGDTTTVEFSQDILGSEELGTKLDEARLTLILNQVRATLRQFGLDGSFRLQTGGKLLCTYLPPATPVEPEPAVKAAAPSLKASSGLGGRNICIGPSHGRFWNGSGWYWQRSDPCGYGEAVLEDLNSIRLMQFLYQYLTQDGATVHVPRELNESNCCNGYEGQPWWKMAAYSWLRINGLPTSVWANASGVGGEETATGRSSDDIRARPRFADYRGSEIYIAHHTNAGGGTGTETFRDTAMEYPAHETASYNLALNVHNNTIDAIREMYDGSWANRGVKDAAGGFGEIRIPNRPACLIELAFHDKCGGDASYLTDDFFRSVAEWGLYKGVCAYFGTSPTWDKYSDEYVSDTIPSTMNAGQSYSVSVTFRNRGVLWREGRAFRLGAAGDSDPFTPTTRHTISGDVRPGNTYTFTFTMTAPATPGTYTTDWRMIREGVTWFGATHSEQVTVISTAPTITQQPVSVTKDPGQTATFTVVASSTTTPSYQWRKNGVNISGATSSTLTLANVQLSDAAFYTVVVSNDGGSVTSSQAQLVVTSSPVAAGTGDGLQGQYFDNQDLTSPVLTRTDATIDFAWGEGSPDASIAVDTFSVRWTGQVVPRYTQDYTFYTRTDDGVRLWVNGLPLVDRWVDQGPTEWSGSIALTAGQAYDIQMEYYENGGGATAQLSWSSASEAKATIPQTQLHVTASPLIVVQPQNQSVVVGNGVTFSVTAQGVLPLTYQWRFNGADISGATLSSYTKNPVQPADAGIYSVVVANAYGSIVSAGATLTVLVPPSIITQPASQTVDQDGAVSFSVAATGTAPLTYQWRFNDANISGATLSSYTKSNVQPADAGGYSVVVNNIAGSATSANALLTVSPSPSITTQPLSQLVGLGSTVNFAVAATGTGPLTYQWRKNGVDLINDGIFSGVTTTTLTLTGVQRTDSGTYSVLVSNPNRSVVSVDALLTVSCPGESIAITLDSTVAPKSVTNNSVIDYTIAGNGKISGAAGLTKEGSSTLTLSTANDYSGATTVIGGRLLVNGSIGSGAVTVADAATLGGNGTIGGAITVESGGLLAPGASIGAIGMLTASGDVTLASGSKTVVEVNRSGPSSDLVTGIGTLTMGGTLQVANTGEALVPGDAFTLFNATTRSGGFAAIGPANPDNDEDLAWDVPALNTTGVLRVHHSPDAINTNIVRGWNTSLKIRWSALFPNKDRDNDPVVLERCKASTKGATITTNATYIFYTLAANESDDFDYVVADNRGGKRTRKVAITVVPQGGQVQTPTVPPSGPVTVTFAGIPTFPYQAQRATNLDFSVGLLRTWTITAPSTGVFQIEDDFSDLGLRPSAAWYRLKYNP
ncbi:MAG TPA: immunoglobulin domain-containing protein [Candidatus Paceibacterota bacterium]|nr:immunoglobulin domain-containing protein [Verrucomicrobiota bacterium]HSA09100.1 immunoglobulin domain-containing protein [Candidatus Paceibacterota bacterium]